MTRLQGRSALVTGSSRGIGAAIARRLAADGAKVVLHAREKRDRADAVAGEIRDAGGCADVVMGDLAQGETALDVVRAAFAVHGALDILVCNAGGGIGGMAQTLDVAAIDSTIALNLRATVLAASEFARLTQSDRGRVVFISSGMATHPAPGVSIGAAAKAGAEAFIRCLAQELGPRGITCNSVAPGCTRTEMIAGGAAPEPLRAQWAGLTGVLGSRAFWRYVPQSALIIGGFMAFQGLWAVPWLMNFGGLPREAAAHHLLLMGSGMLAGFLGIAFGVEPLARRGLSALRLLQGGMGLGLLATLLIVLGVGTGGPLWFGFGLVFSVGNLAYALLQAHYPPTLAGRVNTALNLMVFVGAFGIQWGFGTAVDLLHGAGHTLRDAYQITFGGLLALQVASWIWFLVGTRRER